MASRASRASGRPASRSALRDSARRVDVAVLASGAAAGEERAWEALVGRFDPMLRRVARGFRLSLHDVDDAVQATWLRAVRHLDRLEDPAAVGAWLMTTARRESLRVLQRATREVPSDQAVLHDEEDLGSADDFDALTDDDRRAAVRAALTSLPPRDQALLEMLAGEPAPSYDDVATALGMPVGSIGPTRGRALDRLRRHPRLAGVRAVGAGRSQPAVTRPYARRAVS
jgi:RNA polymerase sigma factor (sigma-70 family)